MCRILPGPGVAAAIIREAEQLPRERIDFHLEGLREDGLLVSEPLAQVMRMAVPA